MGSPVSAVIAELVMQRVEKIALETSSVPIRWWKRYVDDSNACLKDIGNRFFYSLYLLHIRTEYLITYFHLSIAFSCLEIS